MRVAAVFGILALMLMAAAGLMLMVGGESSLRREDLTYGADDVGGVQQPLLNLAKAIPGRLIVTQSVVVRADGRVSGFEFGQQRWQAR